MKTSIFGLALLTLFAGTNALSQEAAPNAPNAPNVPNVPADRPKAVQTDQGYAAYEGAVAPYIAEARRSYPDAKQRFLSGQLGTRPLFVTVRLSEDGRYEDVFVRVLVIDEKTGDISGKIANEVQALHKYQNGQRIITHEADIRDWTIVNPDGTEEGNLVGKFLERYQP